MRCVRMGGGRGGGWKNDDNNDDDDFGRSMSRMKNL
jgi:hypothetical protein